jgi:hypothetical protein
MLTKVMRVYGWVLIVVGVIAASGIVYGLGELVLGTTAIARSQGLLLVALGIGASLSCLLVGRFLTKFEGFR